MKRQFSRFAQATARATGHWAAFIAAVALILGWAVSGPLFHFTDTWQLVINTGTTIITFLMVFLIQHSQNTDTAAIHVKLDGIISAIEGVDDRLVNAEEWTEDELEQRRQRLAHHVDESTSVT